MHSVSADDQPIAAVIDAERIMNKELPEKFLERLTTIVGPSVFTQIQKTFVERPTTFRVNSIKASRQTVRQQFEDAGYKIKEIPWYPDAFILQNKSKRELTETDAYKNGEIYIQSLASMVPPLALGPKPGESVLDLTAAPGSKTSQIAALLARQGTLVANDNNKVRFFKLKHNLELLGVVQDDGFLKLRLEDGSKLCSEYPDHFDRILLDAPCSAEARFIAGEPKTYGYWSERKIKEMAYKQRKLLFSAWYALKPGGTLVYSTCTFAPEENEVQVARLKERFGDAVEFLPAAVAGVKTLPPVKAWRGAALPAEIEQTVRLLPTNHSEGFFVAKLRKRI